ncbi:hypothetical protein EVAR_63761_1 [Eumeta japonica]|uniref:Endonuclease/exonuclease/phosphatase domain-containing protein n=1 Tax=Eumeta variegata TaxID=151549 RepID=A0A4C1ZS04_EUMVA|nr:hypothetical protein EVAR_63761_1 [Eumeta japonica]
MWLASPGRPALEAARPTLLIELFVSDPHGRARRPDTILNFDYFLNAEGLHTLKEGNTPKFEVYRGDRLFSSVVGVTACSSALPDRAEEWQVVRDLIYSDHNAVTFTVNVRIRCDSRPPSGTQAKEAYKKATAETRTASWKRYSLHRMDRACGSVSTGSSEKHQGHREKPRRCLISNRLGISIRSRRVGNPPGGDPFP